MCVSLGCLMCICRVSGVHLEGVWCVSLGCLVYICRVFGVYLRGVSCVSSRCLACICRVCGVYLPGVWCLSAGCVISNHSSNHLVSRFCCQTYKTISTPGNAELIPAQPQRVFPIFPLRPKGPYKAVRDCAKLHKSEHSALRRF